MREGEVSSHRAIPRLYVTFSVPVAVTGSNNNYAAWVTHTSTRVQPVYMH